MNYEIRTDLAIENREIYRKATNLDNEIPGIETNIEKSSDVTITSVNIISEEGSKALKKPIGKYITIESQKMNDEIESVDKEIINTISKKIKELSNLSQNDTVLIVGLGNNNVTPDAIGPKVIGKIQITRHLLEYAPELLKDGTRSISGMVPGVLGTTGIETAEIIKGIVDKTKPNLVIVVDALASKNIDRINKTVQISNSGITPGSGVGNSRFAINSETLGVPVLVIGIPTVVGIPTIIYDAIEYATNGQSKNLSSEYMQKIFNNKKYDFMVTPKDIDEIVENLSTLLANGLNLALNEES